MGLLDKIPGVVWLLALLFGLAWIMTHLHVQAVAVAGAVAPMVVWLIALAVAAAPYGAGIAAVLAVLYLVAHHHGHAIAAGFSTAALVVLKLLFVFGLGPWALAQFGLQSVPGQ